MIMKAEQFTMYLFWDRHGFKDEYYLHHLHHLQSMMIICLMLSIILDSETLGSYFY